MTKTPSKTAPKPRKAKAKPETTAEPEATFQTSRETTTTETSTSTTATDDGAHLDSIGIDEIEDIDGGVDGVFTIDEDGQRVDPDPFDEPPQQIDKDTFFVVFSSAFNMPGAFVPDLAPLAIKDSETPAARAASDGCYCLLEIYYPKALMPGSETLAHLLAVIPFAMIKVQAMRMIIAARKAPPPKQPEPDVNKGQTKDAETPPVPAGELVEMQDWNQP